MGPVRRAVHVRSVKVRTSKVLERFSTYVAETDAADAAFERLCLRWEAGNLSDTRSSLLCFVKDHCGGRVSLKWPPGYCLRVGGRRYFGILSGSGRLYRFGCLRVFKWVYFVGIVCKREGWGGSGPEPWILVASSGAVFAYESDEDRVHILCDRLSSFRDASVGNLPSFYDGCYEGPSHELRWYGHEPSHDCCVAMDSDPDAFNVLAYVNRCSGDVLRNRWDSTVITIGTEDFICQMSVMHPCVLACLTNMGYSVIGLSSRFCRLLLIETSSACIYALMSKGYVMKVAENFSMLVRDRLRTLAGGRPTCFVPEGETDGYVPVGTQVSFNCSASYTLPGDRELLCHWVTRYADVLGWPSCVSLEDDIRNGISIGRGATVDRSANRFVGQEPPSAARITGGASWERPERS